MKLVYIVICYKTGGGDGTYYIDSVWTSDKKAQKRAEKLNSDSKKEWRDRHCYGFFQAELMGFIK